MLYVKVCVYLFFRENLSNFVNSEYGKYIMCLHVSLFHMV